MSTATPPRRTSGCLYGTWNFGAGTLLVGQDYGPYFYLVSRLCGPGGGECNGIGFGSIYSGRNPQLKLIFGGLQVAIVKPAQVSSFAPSAALVGAFAGTGTLNANSTIFANNQTTAGTGWVDNDFTFPKQEAKKTLWFFLMPT